MKFFGNLFLFLLCSLSVFSQKNLSLTGTLIDKADNEPIVAGSINLLNSKDSTYVVGGISDAKGAFSLKNLSSGNYILKVTYIGYLPFFENVSLTSDKAVTNLGTLALNTDDILLKETIVEGKKPDVTVKGDTLEYDATSFKTQENAVVEDLLKKLPGVEVDKDGKVTAAGKEVKKFLVDGKDFFSNDPTVASKNLPAEMIDKLQVLDRKSDMARMTGFDDGEEETIINLTIRAGMKQGTMGNVLAGLGKDVETDDDMRYQAGAFVNHMQNNDRYTLILGANNNNNMGASDLGAAQFGGGGRMRRGPGGNSGIAESTNGMFSANKEFSKDLNVNADIRLDNSDRTSRNETEQSTISEKISQLDKSLTNTNYVSKSLSANFTIEWTLDTLNSLIARPTFTINSSRNTENGSTDRFNYDNNDPIIYTNSSSGMKGGGNAFGGSLDFAHKFKGKPGRVISVNVSGNYNDQYSKERSLWLSENYINGIYDNDTYRNQRIENDNNSNSYRTTISYVEPIGHNNFLQASYRYSYSESKDINSTYDLNSPLSVGDLLFNNPSLSGVTDIASINDLQSRSTMRDATEQRIGLSFKSVRAKYNYTIGFNVDPSNSLNETYQPLDGLIPNQTIPADFGGRLPNVMGDTLISSIKQDVINFSPVLNYRYSFGPRSELRIDYEGRTNQPSAAQLRDFTDKSRPTEWMTGNPNLKPGYSNTLRTRFNKYVPETQLMYNVNIDGALSFNDITSVTQMNVDGIRETTYKNVNGNWNTSLWGMFNVPLHNKKFSVSNFARAAYTNQNSFVNETANNSKNFSFNTRPRANYRSDLFDLGVSVMINYSNISYTARPESNQKTVSYGAGGNTTWYLPYKWNIDSDINFMARTGFAAGFNVPETIWNAAVSKQVFNKRYGTGTLKLQAYDILSDRKSIMASATTNGYRTQKITVMPSFFMCSFIYKFSVFPKSSTATESDVRGGDGRWPGGPPPGGGWGGRGGGGGGRPF